MSSQISAGGSEQAVFFPFLFLHAHPIHRTLPGGLLGCNCLKLSRTRNRCEAFPFISLLHFAFFFFTAGGYLFLTRHLAQRKTRSCCVAPPQDLQITDPGLLGSLDIEWKPPPNIQTSNGCTVKYKCEYRNAGDREWKVIFTRKLKLRVGFDLSRTAEVKVQTLLKGWCTNDVEVQSEWLYATFRVPLQGKLESEVQNFHCIYHDWEYLKCTWQPGLLAPRGVNYGLYYWYEGLEHTVQCDHYIQDHGVNMGCMLQNLSQAEYKDLSICVNGSVAATLLRPLYATLRLHNLAKPSPPQQLVVSMSAAEELRVVWSPPGGQTPPQCLEYESVSTQVETAFTISRANRSRVSCVRVRGRTNNFCADEGFWSEWTQECFSVSRKEVKQLFILIPVILGLSSSLLIFTLIGQCKKKSPAGKPSHTLVGC
ncbi:interleukin-13 receptor subunit alpha-2 isoform X4 [Gallus gallus]|uniref:interleukin-13 receptor subunit alpha-2 isoform X4 n=1 Tax=Gallus gallus TaxID=9031 RepID=UPI001EFFE497|nr:interleukin-13 receptor subunit alpha-2 isoform X4 [Gallus gallus]